jgi:Protein of unknown function (DUF3179)
MSHVESNPQANPNRPTPGSPDPPGSTDTRGSTDTPGSSAAATPRPYWTPARLLAGVVMAFAAVGAVAYVQWDEVDRLMHPPPPVPDPWSAKDGSAVAVFDLNNLQLPQEGIRSGGPPKDGIPAITDPKTAPVADAGFMLDDDRVVGVTINGESRAYPIKVLNLHECYNDVLAGVPIAVIFCPLCDSVTVVDRRLDGKTYEFGISGLLYNSNVLLYDRQDDALWSQVALMAISGPNAGKSLTHLDGWEITTFARWRAARPDSTVATLDTGYYPPDRYGGVAYAAYFQTDRLMFPAEPTDPRFPNKFPVVGVLVDGTAKAYPVDAIVSAPGGRVQDTVGGETVVLEATGEPASVGIVQTPDGSQVVYTFWFAWYAFHPETEVYKGGVE